MTRPQKRGRQLREFRNGKGGATDQHYRRPLASLQHGTGQVQLRGRKGKLLAVLALAPVDQGVASQEHDCRGRFVLRSTHSLPSAIRWNVS